MLAEQFVILAEDIEARFDSKLDQTIEHFLNANEAVNNLTEVYNLRNIAWQRAWTLVPVTAAFKSS